MPEIGAKLADCAVAGEDVGGFSQAVDERTIERAGVGAVDQFEPTFFVLRRECFQLERQRWALDSALHFGL